MKKGCCVEEEDEEWVLEGTNRTLMREKLRKIMLLNKIKKKKKKYK
jgi:hypothetical protein